jgi:hypothetical protein
MHLVSYDRNIRFKPQAARGDRLGETYRWHFNGFARDAARHALLAALQTESSPEEAVAFFDSRFNDLCRRFVGSFADLWRIDPAFHEAAIQAMRGRPGGAP